MFIVRGLKRSPATLPPIQPLFKSLMLKLPPTEQPQLFRSKTASISTENTILTSGLKSMGLCSTTSSFPPASTSSYHPFYPPFQIRRTITILCPSDALLGFFLVGHYTYLSPLPNPRPIPKSIGPALLNVWPRSVLSFLSPSPIHLLCVFSDLCGQGLHRRCEAISMIWFYVCHFKTLSSTLLMAVPPEHLCLLILIRQCSRVFYLKPLIDFKHPTIPISATARIMPSQRVDATSMGDPDLSSKPLLNRDNNGANHHLKWLRLKKTGIMISFPMNGDYRSFFNPSTLFFLDLKFNEALTINLKVSFYAIRRLRKNGIMIPSPMSGGYRSFLIPLSPTSPDYSTVVTLLLADELILLALLVPASISAMEPFSTSLSLLTVTIVSSNALHVDDFSTNRVITCAISLSSFGPQALMDPLLNSSSYLCVAFVFTLLCCFCFSSSHINFVFVAVLSLVPLL